MNAASNLAATESQRDEWMTVPQAMEALGETRYMVMRRGLQGELTIRTFARMQLVNRESVDRVRAAKDSEAATSPAR